MKFGKSRLLSKPAISTYLAVSMVANCFIIDANIEKINLLEKIRKDYSSSLEKILYSHDYKKFESLSFYNLGLIFETPSGFFYKSVFADDIAAEISEINSKFGIDLKTSHSGASATYVKYHFPNSSVSLNAVIASSDYKPVISEGAYNLENVTLNDWRKAARIFAYNHEGAHIFIENGKEAELKGLFKSEIELDNFLASFNGSPNSGEILPDLCGYVALLNSGYASLDNLESGYGDLVYENPSLLVNFLRENYVPLEK